MTCFCSAQLTSLMGSLKGLPSLAHLVPPVPMNVVAAAGMAAGAPAPNLGVQLGASASASAAVVANLSAMASLSAALQTAMGMNLTAAMAPPLQARVQASLAGTVNSFNAAGNLLAPFAELLKRLLQELTGLMHLSSLVLAVRAAFGIDLRASGAMLALQARLNALATVPAAASARASAQVSAVGAAMAALGLKMNAQGALSASLSAQALARMTAGLPAIGAHFPLMSLLSAVMAVLDMIKRALGVDLLAANATARLQAVLSAYPLAALAKLQVTANLSPKLALAVNENAKLAAVSKLDLRAVGAAHLPAVGPLAMLLKLSADARLGLPAGSCGKPCPLALLGAPAMPSPSGMASLSV
jgi:hypothetical protein